MTQISIFNQKIKIEIFPLFVCAKIESFKKYYTFYFYLIQNDLIESLISD
jgi:hypothetical protein